MRICVYCGKELGQGEVCDCKMSVQIRSEKKDTPHNDKTQNDNYYRTGYTKPKSRLKRKWERFKNKQSARKNSRVNRRQTQTGGIREIFNDIWQFIKSPVESIENPKAYTMLYMLILSAIEGAIVGLGVFFVTTGASRSVFRNLANIMGLGGVAGYKVMLAMLYWAISGMICAVVLFLIYTVVFWLIDRFVFRRHTEFLSIAQRLVMTTVPMSVFVAVGVVISFISTTTLMILILCGVFVTLILSYIALSDEWSVFPPSKVLYSMILGYFVLFTFICSVLRTIII